MLRCPKHGCDMIPMILSSFCPMCDAEKSAPAQLEQRFRLIPLFDHNPFKMKIGDRENPFFYVEMLRVLSKVDLSKDSLIVIKDPGSELLQGSQFKDREELHEAWYCSWRVSNGEYRAWARL